MCLEKPTVAYEAKNTKMSYSAHLTDPLAKELAAVRVQTAQVGRAMAKLPGTKSGEEAAAELLGGSEPFAKKFRDRLATQAFIEENVLLLWVEKKDKATAMLRRVGMLEEDVNELLAAAMSVSLAGMDVERNDRVLAIAGTPWVVVTSNTREVVAPLTRTLTLEGLTTVEGMEAFSRVRACRSRCCTSSARTRT